MKSLLKPYQNDALLPFLRDSGKKKKVEPESPKAQYGEKCIKPIRKTVYVLRIFSVFISNSLTRRWKTLIVNNGDKKGGRQAFSRTMF